MKLLLVTQYFWPENFRVNELAKELVARGHDVTVLTGYPNYPSGEILPQFEQTPRRFDSYFGATICRVPMLARASGGFRLTLNYISFVVGACLFAPLRLSGQRFHLIFVFQPSPVTVGIPAVLLGWIKRAPIVFWVQDLWPETLSAVGAVRAPGLLATIGVLVSFIYNRCAMVLGQSQGFCESIAKYCRDTSKIRCLPNWTDQVPSSSQGVGNSADKKRFTVVFAGNVGVAQDFPAVLDAAEQLKSRADIQWWIVGDGRMSEWLGDQVKRRGLSDRVFLLGRFPPEDMPRFYEQADALLVSLKRDPVFALTIPSKVQSYLMTGVPLLGMLDGEGAKLIREANAGLTCDAGDAKGLADAVSTLAGMEPEQRQSLGKNGLIYAQREFDRGVLVDRLEVWFSELVPACGSLSRRCPAD